MPRWSMAYYPFHKLIFDGGEFLIFPNSVGSLFHSGTTLHLKQLAVNFSLFLFVDILSSSSIEYFLYIDSGFLILSILVLYCNHCTLVGNGLHVGCTEGFPGNFGHLGVRVL